MHKLLNTMSNLAFKNQEKYYITTNSAGYKRKMKVEIYQN